MAGDDMQSNGKLNLNWATFNIPTIIAILTVGWYLATKQERQDARLDAIEASRAQARAENADTLRQLQLKVSGMDNIAYRITVAENGITNVNTRIDRVGESVTERLDRLQESLTALATKIEVLDQRLVSSMPKRAGFDRGDGNVTR